MSQSSLDPEMEHVLTHFAQQPLADADARNAIARRQLMVERAAWLAPRPQPIALVRDFLTGQSGVPVRVYDPRGSGQLPLVVFVHGGGWVTGDLDTHDDLCRRLALRAGCLVMAVDYRRTPEHAYPAALEDLSSVFDWLTSARGIENALPTWDRRRIAVAGDSAGGNLAAVLAGLYRRDPRLYAQLLIYPMLDATMRSASYRDPQLGVTFPSSEVAWCYELYCREPAQRLDWRVSPIFSDPVGLPCTGIVLAEFDVLLGENREHARRLRSAGVSVETLTGRSLAHGFIRMTARIRAADRILDRSAAFLRRSFAGEVPKA
jgi:acetyl esterase